MKWSAHTLLVLALLAGPNTSPATPVDSMVHRGELAYASGEHALALQYFDSVLTTHNSAGLQLNIGNCHYKLGDTPRAILHYERALRLEPGAEDVIANLDMARSKLVDRINERPDPLFGALWSRLHAGKDLDHWPRMALWACLLFFGTLAAALLLRGRSITRYLNGLAAVLFLATLTAVLLASVRYRELHDDRSAIIMANKVDVRSEPREGTTVLFVLHKGTKVQILQERDGWNEVRLPNGNVGWMPPATLEVI